MSDDELQLRAQGRVGTVLCGKYRIDGVLGIGGMAVVYAATHRNQKRVAIKMLHAELSIRQELRTRFFREGYAANTVDHPGAVAVLDDDVAEDGAAFLVMEQLEGDEVERLWEKHGSRFDPRVVLSIADPLLAVLGAAHAKSIVHRDIKPANLYITRDGSLKVLDFGIARVRDAASGSDHATKTGLMMGTPAFMAPEQALAKSKEIDGTSDLWSVGATMFTLLSGQLVHEGESATAILVQTATQPARSLGSTVSGVDPRIAEIVDRALAFDKAKRWPDAASMRAAVRAAHLDIFGVPVSKDPLEQLFGAEGSASTMIAMSAAAPTAAPAPAFASAPTPPPAALASAGPVAMPWTPQGYAPGATAPAQPIMPYGDTTTARPISTGAEAQPAPAPRRDSRGPLVILAGIAILACAGMGFMVWRGANARSNEQEPTAASGVPVSASAPPSVEPADSGDAGDAGDTPDSGDAPVASTSRPVLPSNPVPRTTPRPTPAPTPAPTPTFTAPPPPPPPPVPVAPPPVCRSQCADIARGCKARCKAQIHYGRERHGCQVDCESVERDCKSRSPC